MEISTRHEFLKLDSVTKEVKQVYAAEIRKFVASLWLLGAVLPVTALVLLPPQGRFVCFALAVLLETGHSLSPIAVAWSHREFRRRVILKSPRKYVLFPMGLFVIALTVGIVTSYGVTSYRLDIPHQMMRLTDLRNPFPVLVWIYIIWNMYHFGMQNFGVLALCFPKMPRDACRFSIKAACVALIVVGMYALPTYMRSWTVAMICVGVFSFNHWIVAIGLCSRVSRHAWLFIAAVCAAGAIGFVWIIPTPQGNLVRVIPVLIAARMGLGLVHFLYDRWIWKMSDPAVRATIGRSLISA
jgi:hypothetical protein